MKNSRPAFTFIELMVAIGVLTVLVLVSVPSYFAMRNSIFLGDEIQRVVEVLRTAQNRAITSQGGVKHGVHFDNSVTPNAYSIFGGNDWTTYTYHTDFTLNHGVKVISITAPDILFDRLTGTAAASTIVIGYTGGEQKTVQVDTTGKISLP